MQIPNDMKQAALAAHRDRVGWNDFLKTTRRRSGRPSLSTRSGTGGCTAESCTSHAPATRQASFRRVTLMQCPGPSTIPPSGERTLAVPV